MRFTLVSVALLALAHSVAPGVHGAPAVASDHSNSLAVRQDPVSVVDNLLHSVLGVLTGLLGSTVPIPTIQKIAEQLVKELQSSVGAASGQLPRALPASDATFPASSASLTTHSMTTTTSHGLATATARIASSVSLSTPKTSSKPPSRIQRQLPTSLPTSVLSAVPGIVGSQSALQPVQSILASVLSAVASKLDSVTSKPATSKPTSSVR